MAEPEPTDETSYLLEGVTKTVPPAFSDRLRAGNDVMQAASVEPFGTEVPKPVKKLLGLGGEERIQTWPEVMVRSGFTLAHDVYTRGIGDENNTDSEGPLSRGEVADRAKDMASFQLAQSAFPKQLTGRPAPLVDLGDGRVARIDPGAPAPHVIGPMPREADFATAAKVLGGEATEANLKRAWIEDGVHPAEAVNDAAGDAFVKHQITTEPTLTKLDPADVEVLTKTGGAPHGLSAEVTSEPPVDVPLTKQPASLAGTLSAAAHDVVEQIFDLGRDARNLVAPMASGTRDTMAMAKDFANVLRRNRWDWTRIDDDIAKRFDPEQRARMWNAADEESVALQTGESREHQGLTTLEPHERAAVEELQMRAQRAWVRAVDLGMVEGEGLPSYTPRMVLNATRGGDAGPTALNALGLNLRTTTGGLRQRLHMTVEETEAAARAKYGPDAEVARDIRALPLATAQLEDAIAGRTLIRNIKDYGARTGTETVVEGMIPTGSTRKFFTIDHPAFRTWRPKLQQFEDGTYGAMKDAQGNAIYEQVPVYVHGDFEGPLRAVLTQKSGAVYNAIMTLKGKTMSLIMNSPAIHNMVELGRALPAMPGKILSGRVYRDGNMLKNDPNQMSEAINAGMVPIGKRFFNQDITSIMEAPDLAPGRSWTAQVLGETIGRLPQSGMSMDEVMTGVKRDVDKAGDFWHNKLLWDRIADLQAGLYGNFRNDMLARGVDPKTAQRIAAHWANRYAGALPVEAMSDAARKIANLTLFSRTFTLGNIGVMKDMLTGLPRDVLAQIDRDAGGLDPNAASYSKSMARRKAFAIVTADIGLAIVGNSVLQSVINVIRTDRTVDEEMHKYAERMADAIQNVREHPLAALQPFDFLSRLSSTYENEPGKQDRVRVGTTKDGTAIYMKNPIGRIGEEFMGYMTGPLDMMRRKLGTVARPAWEILSNDKGFGRKTYDPNADTPEKYLRNMGLIAAQITKSQFPENQASAAMDLVKGRGDTPLNLAKVLGPIAGMQFSQGAPGGPAVGELYHERAMNDFKVQLYLPEIRRQMLRGDLAGAHKAMTDLGIPSGLQTFYERTTLNPASRLSGRAIEDFYYRATPEQKQRLWQSATPEQRKRIPQ